MGETGWHYAQPKMCAKFVYDLNGKRDPNTKGKDIGIITALYATDSVVVAPNPIAADPMGRPGSMNLNLNKYCTKLDPNSKVPNREELTSRFYNKEIITFNIDTTQYSGDYWAAPLTSSSATGWCLRTKIDQWAQSCGGGNGFIRCIKR